MTHSKLENNNSIISMTAVFPVNSLGIDPFCLLTSVRSSVSCVLCFLIAYIVYIILTAHA